MITSLTICHDRLWRSLDSYVTPGPSTAASTTCRWRQGASSVWPDSTETATVVCRRRTAKLRSFVCRTKWTPQGNFSERFVSWKQLYLSKEIGRYQILIGSKASSMLLNEEPYILIVWSSSAMRAWIHWRIYDWKYRLQN